MFKKQTNKQAKKKICKNNPHLPHLSIVIKINENWVSSSLTCSHIISIRCCCVFLFSFFYYYFLSFLTKYSQCHFITVPPIASVLLLEFSLLCLLFFFISIFLLRRVLLLFLFIIRIKVDVLKK